MDAGGRGASCSTPAHALHARRWRRRARPRSPPSTGSRSAAAASWRWRATSASRRSRPPSASPRSTSGSSPASAAPSGCRGWSARRKALEMNLTGDAIAAYEAYGLGLANQVVPDHELFDTALHVGAQARRPGAARDRADQAACRRTGDLDEGIAAEKRGLRDGVRLRGREGGHLAPSSRSGGRSSRASEAVVAAGVSRRRRSGSRSCCRLAQRRRRSPAPGSRCPPASPTSARPGPGCGRTSTRWRSRTSTPSGATPTASGASTATRFAIARRQAAERARTRRSPSSSGAAWSRAVDHPEHRPPAPHGGHASA